MIIVLTGIDGSGKSTAARALASSVRAEGGRALLLSNHAGRRVMSLLSARLGVRLPAKLADAVETALRVGNVLVSHLRASRFDGLMIMDRHLHCQLALRTANGLPRGRFLPWLLARLPEPDAIFHLDIDPVERTTASLSGALTQRALMTSPHSSRDTGTCRSTRAS